MMGKLSHASRSGMGYEHLVVMEEGERRRSDGVWMLPSATKAADSPMALNLTLPYSTLYLPCVVP